MGRSHGQPRNGAVVVDVADTLVDSGDGVHWTLDQPGSDLNVNLVRLDPGHVAEEHVNDEVDVLIVTVGGDGVIEVDGSGFAVHDGVLIHVPRGASRRIEAGSAGLGYVTIHRRRSLTIGRPRPA